MISEWSVARAVDLFLPHRHRRTKNVFRDHIMILGYLPILLLLWDWRIAEACQHKTFELYDGYELTAPNFAETIGHQLHFAVSSLQECIGRCASSGQCTGVNYNGNTCRELDSHFSRQATLTRSANSTSNFNIYANKICLNGRRSWVLFATFSSSTCQIQAVGVNTGSGHSKTSWATIWCIRPLASIDSPPNA